MADAPGTIDLGAALGCELVARLRAVRAAPAFSLMVALPHAVPARPGSGPAQGGIAEPREGRAAGRALDAAAVTGSRELAWVACDSAKPGAKRARCWLLCQES